MKTKIFIISLVFLFSCAPIDDAVIFNNIQEQPAVKIKDKTASGPGSQSILMVDDFNVRNKNSLKQDVQAWCSDPKDSLQFCKMQYIAAEKIGDKGYSLQIKYDVDSPNTAYNGIYSKLNDLNVKNYPNFVIHIRGDELEGFTSVVKLELKNSTETGIYYIRGISPDWQKIIIPVAGFNGLQDLSALTELTLVFEDSLVTVKSGTIYLEDIYFSK